MVAENYIYAPCVVCGNETVFACSDCAIEAGKSVHVCSRLECRYRHEHDNPQHPITNRPLAEHNRNREQMLPAPYTLWAGRAGGH
jgi:hypothetical protein